MKTNIKGNLMYGCAKILCFVVNILELIEKIIKAMERLLMFCLQLLFIFVLYVVFLKPSLFTKFIDWLRVATDQDIVNSIQSIFVLLIGMSIILWLLFMLTSHKNEPYLFKWKVIKKDNKIKFIGKKYLFFETQKVDKFVLHDLSVIKVTDNEKVEKNGDLISIIDKKTEEIKRQLLVENIYEIYWKCSALGVAKKKEEM